MSLPPLSLRDRVVFGSIAAAMAAAGHALVEPKSEARTGRPFTSAWLLVLHAAGMLLLAWLG